MVELKENDKVLAVYSGYEALMDGVSELNQLDRYSLTFVHDHGSEKVFSDDKDTGLVVDVVEEIYL
jgi:hypothetical protein